MLLIFNKFFNPVKKISNMQNTRNAQHGLTDGAKLKKGTPSQDEFVYNSTDSENSNLAFRKEVIEFYPEDEQIMQQMDTQERIRYRRELKRNHKYIVKKNDSIEVASA